MSEFKHWLLWRTNNKLPGIGESSFVGGTVLKYAYRKVLITYRKQPIEKRLAVVHIYYPHPFFYLFRFINVTISFTPLA